MLDIVASYDCMKFQGKLMNQTWENDKKPNSGINFRSFDLNLGPQIFFLWVLPLLKVRDCCKLSLYAISRGKKPHFGHDSGTLGPNLGCKKFFFENLISSFPWHHGQLSSCTILEKTNDSILRKLSEGQTNWQTDRGTDRLQWFHRLLFD